MNWEDLTLTLFLDDLYFSSLSHISHSFPFLQLLLFFNRPMIKFMFWLVVVAFTHSTKSNRLLNIWFVKIHYNPSGSQETLLSYLAPICHTTNIKSFQKKKRPLTELYALGTKHPLELCATTKLLLWLCVHYTKLFFTV